LSEKQTEELDALASAKSALEASVEILERELDNRRDKIAALQSQLQAATTLASNEEETMHPPAPPVMMSKSLQTWNRG
jgi:prefoldin subunit 5